MVGSQCQWGFDTRHTVRNRVGHIHPRSYHRSSKGRGRKGHRVRKDHRDTRYLDKHQDKL